MDDLNTQNQEALPAVEHGVPEPEYAMERLPMPGMPPNACAPGTYAWTAAFVAFSRGYSIDQIAHVYSIPVRALARRAADERWAELVKEMPRGRALENLADRVKADLKALKENRDKNLAVFNDLREILVDQLAKYKKGELKMERLFHNPKLGRVVRALTEPTTGDLVNFANAAKTIAEGTYRALGDHDTAEDRKKEGPPPASITILLPGAIVGNPSPEAQEPKSAQVVDLR